MRSCCAFRSLSTAVCLLMRSNPVMRLTHNIRAYIAANLPTSTFLIARSDVETVARRPAYEGIGDGGGRRPGKTEPKGREHHGKQRESRIVGHEGEAVEPGADADAGRDQRNVHGAEEEHPAPCHGHVRQKPEVDQAIQRHQHHQQEHEPPVVGVPEARSVGYLERGHQPDEPATPDRNPRGVRHDIRVGPDGR